MVFTLALAIGAATAIFSVVYGVQLRPLPYAEPDRILAIFEVAGSAAARKEAGRWCAGTIFQHVRNLTAAVAVIAAGLAAHTGTYDPEPEVFDDQKIFGVGVWKSPASKLRMSVGRSRFPKASE